jgi:predicted amidohydrolase
MGDPTVRDIELELATLLAAADQGWPTLSFADRFGTSPAFQALLEAARDAGARARALASRPRKALAAILDWRTVEPPSALRDLAGLIACDEVLTPSNETERANDRVDFDPNGYLLATGRMVVYCHPRPAWRGGLPRPTPVEAMRPALQSRLRVIRYFVLETSSNIAVRPFREVLDCALGAAGPQLRIGLFSIRGFHALFQRSTTVKSGPLGALIHGFRAVSVVPHRSILARLTERDVDDQANRNLYHNAIRRIVDEAQAHQINIVVLPELAVDEGGVEALASRLRNDESDNIYPQLVFAGSWHIDSHGRWANTCSVIDRRGVVQRRQNKSNHYSFRPRDLIPHFLGRGHWAKRLFQAAVVGADLHTTGWMDEWYSEDISLATEFHLVPTPIGVFAIGICADVLPSGSTSPFAQVCALPVDWLVVPSYNPGGDSTDFINRAKDFSRANGIFLYVNADCTVSSIVAQQIVDKLSAQVGRRARGGTHRLFQAATAAREWLQRRTSKPSIVRTVPFRVPTLDAFVSLPWEGPIASWLSGQSNNDAIVNRIQSGEVEGLVVEVRPPGGTA